MATTKQELIVIDVPGGKMTIGGKVHAAIASVIKEVDPVGKTKKNQQQGYKFRPIDEFMNALNAQLPKHGLHIRPVHVESLNDEHIVTTTSNGNQRVKHTVSVVVTYVIQHEDGSFVMAQTRGQGEDYGDKASNKSLASAFKYLIMQAFMVPTRDIVDGDDQTPDPVDPDKLMQEEFNKLKNQLLNAKNASQMNLWLAKVSAKPHFKETLKGDMVGHIATIGVKFDKTQGKFVKKS